MPLHYQSGEEVKKRDKVLYAEMPGEIDLVADPSLADPDTVWYVTEYGGGVMIREPKVHGLVFVSKPNEDDELEFVSRGN